MRQSSCLTLLLAFSLLPLASCQGDCASFCLEFMFDKEATWNVAYYEAIEASLENIVDTLQDYTGDQQYAVQQFQKNVIETCPFNCSNPSYSIRKIIPYPWNGDSNLSAALQSALNDMKVCNPLLPKLLAIVSDGGTSKQNQQQLQALSQQLVQENIITKAIQIDKDKQGNKNLHIITDDVFVYGSEPFNFANDFWDWIITHAVCYQGGSTASTLSTASTTSSSSTSRKSSAVPVDRTTSLGFSLPTTTSTPDNDNTGLIVAIVILSLLLIALLVLLIVGGCVYYRRRQRLATAIVAPIAAGSSASEPPNYYDSDYMSRHQRNIKNPPPPEEAC